MEVQSEFGPTWFHATTDVPESRSALDFDLDVEVCVVGGGLAGLTTALEVARRGLSVALLEARRIAWNASGRNCGLVLPGYAASPEAIIERVGLRAAKNLWALSEYGAQYVRRAVAEAPEILEGEGWLDVSKTARPQARMKRANLLGEHFGATVEYWPTQQVREVLGTRHYFGGLHFPHAFQINPLAYALRLAAAAEQAGARIFEHTPATTIDPAGVRKRIATPRGRVRASHIVLAANTGLGDVAKHLAAALVPVTAYAGLTKPLGEALANAIRYPGAISDSREADYHYRVVGGDRLLWSGGAAIGPPLTDGRAASFRASRIERRFAGAIMRTFPQLGRVAFEGVWPGQMGFAIHRMPQVGQIEPGVWLASAFGGHGLNVTAVAGEIIARAIAEGDELWRLFVPYELVWAGGRGGRMAIRAVAGWRRHSELARARISRWREDRQRQRARDSAAVTPKHA